MRLRAITTYRLAILVFRQQLNEVRAQNQAQYQSRQPRAKSSKSNISKDVKPVKGHVKRVQQVV